MAQFHFIEDYERHVAALLEQHPVDEAMSLAVGGLYDVLGRIELGILQYVGVRSGMTVLDMGCGSGRLSAVLGTSGVEVDYVGIDIVQSLLDYAKTKSPAHYRFILHRELSIPLPDASVDIACAFSVFTHLLHQESFIYLQELRRVVRPGGLVMFSFLEFASPNHWAIFEATVAGQRNTQKPVLNQFIERNVIEAWAAHLGFRVERLVDDSTDLAAGPLGQSLAFLRVPKD